MAPDTLSYGTFSLSPSLPSPAVFRESLLLSTRLSVSVEGSNEREILAALVCLFVPLRSTSRIIAGCRSPISVRPPPTAPSANAEEQQASQPPTSSLYTHPCWCCCWAKKSIVPQKPNHPTHPPTQTRTTTPSAQVAGFGSIRLQNTRGKKINKGACVLFSLPVTWS